MDNRIKFQQTCRDIYQLLTILPVNGNLNEKGWKKNQTHFSTCVELLQTMALELRSTIEQESHKNEKET